MLKISDELYSLVSSGKLDDVKQALQIAVELEHSTIPPYLFAKYSLGKSLKNFAVAEVLRGIVLQEMHHMLLAGNLLKAIGGNPIIDHPDFVPAYPTNLPGTVASDLVVPLAPFSKAIVENVFMRIEQPEHILAFRTSGLVAGSKTIGEFYGRIRDAFVAEGRNWIVDTAGTAQPTHFGFSPAIQKIINVEDALRAIELIVEQGEGTDLEPVVSDGDNNPNNDELAHYYRFAEIVKGRLKRNPNADPSSPPDERYVYDASDPVPFEAAEVLPLRSNPKSADFHPDSLERHAIDAFNRNYTDVLRQLHAAFNGQPNKIFGAVGSMNAMGLLAGNIIDITLEDGTRPGPTFEYAIESVGT